MSARDLQPALDFLRAIADGTIDPRMLPHAPDHAALAAMARRCGFAVEDGDIGAAFRLTMRARLVRAAARRAAGDER